MNTSNVSQGDRIDNEDMNNLINRFNSIKNDPLYGSTTQLDPNTHQTTHVNIYYAIPNTVNDRQLIEPVSDDEARHIVQDLSAIKCRNITGYTYIYYTTYIYSYRQQQSRYRPVSETTYYRYYDTGYYYYVASYHPGYCSKTFYDQNGTIHYGCINMREYASTRYSITKYDSYTTYYYRIQYYYTTRYRYGTSYHVQQEYVNDILCNNSILND